MNTKLKEEFMQKFAQKMEGMGYWFTTSDADAVWNWIEDHFPDTMKISQSYPNEYKISTSKQTVNLEEYIKASQHDGL